MASADHKLYKAAEGDNGSLSAGRRRKETRTYLDRRDYMRRYQNAWLKKRRQEWLAANGPCRCGSWDRLEVDHRNREHKVSHRIWSWTKSRRDEELKKCQPLCFKCHKKKTAKEQFVHGVNGYKRGCRCIICRPAKLAEMREYYRRRRALTHPIPNEPPSGGIHV